MASAGDRVRLEAYVASLTPADTARAMAHLDDEDHERVLDMLAARDGAHLLEELPDAQAIDILEHLPTEVAASILHELPSDEQADLISGIGDVEAEAILDQLEDEEARDIRSLAQFDDDVAGGLMVTEFLSFNQDISVEALALDLRTNAAAYASLDIQYVYIVDDAQRLTGVVRLRDLILSPPEQSVTAIMITDPTTVGDQTPLDALDAEFDRGSLLALPVVNDDGVLVGIVKRLAVEAAIASRAEESHLRTQGIVGGEELRTMPLLRRSRRRLSWLSVNIVLNVIAASVIAAFEETLAAVIALAFFLPIISDMSGCSGNQAVAVSIRELTLGLIRPRELWWVWIREIGVGIINGIVLGCLIGGVAWMWKGNPYLGLVVGLALMVNTMVAVSIGGAIPLLLKRFDLDPALASGPVLTTITDICGFFLVLGLATLMLSQLVGAT